MDSDDEMEVTPSWKGVPGTIVCINAYGNNNESAEVAHVATCRVIRQYLRTSGSNFIGVCFYGTQATNKSILGINSVEEIFPLKKPVLDDYQNLQKVSVSTISKAQDLILSEVLWYCSRAFNSCKNQLSSRNIILLSRLDEPPLLSDQRPALKRVVELADTNIELKLLNISQTEYPINEFYKNFMIEAQRKEEVILPEPVWDLKSVENLIHQQSHRHLAVASLSFEIGEGVEIGVGVYALLKGYAQPMKKVDLDNEDYSILTSVNKTMKVAVKQDSDMDVDEPEPKPVPLLKSELVHYKVIGGEKVVFTDDEMKMIRNPFGPPMLKLLGFKPASTMCKEKWFFKPCYFLFPKEDLIEGSIVAFKAMYEACLATKTVAICVLCTRVNSKPKIVALSPSSKPLDLDVNIGFDIIQVPFVENVRQMPNVHEETEDKVEISQANKTVMKDILQELKFEYKPDVFENPKVQMQYRAVEAIALDEDDHEEFIDTTKADIKRFLDLKDDMFHELFGPFGPVAVKKPSSSKADGPPNKKVKQDIDHSLLQQRLDNKKVNDYTVPQLKDILNSIDSSDLPALTGKKKNELVELVYKFCK